MAKRITFLLVFIFVTILASVTALAGTETTTPEAGFTEDKIHLTEPLSIDDLERTYSELFFNPDTSSNVKIVDEIKYKRSASVVHNRRHRFYCSGQEWKKDDPLVMLMYIKKDGEYVPLNDVDTGINLTEQPYYLSTTVDLEYIGLNKVNDVRIIIFRKSDAGNLVKGGNVQIENLQISFRDWNFIEKVEITFKNLTGK